MGAASSAKCLLRSGTTSGVYGVEEPHECYMTYTTERAEKEALKLYKKELRCSHQEAIEHIAGTGMPAVSGSPCLLHKK